VKTIGSHPSFAPPGLQRHQAPPHLQGCQEGGAAAEGGQRQGRAGHPALTLLGSRALLVGWGAWWCVYLCAAVCAPQLPATSGPVLEV